MGRGAVMTKKTRKQQSYKVKGEELVSKAKELIKEGNIRKISIKNKDGKTIASFPLTFGLLGTVIAPVLASISAIAALVSECTISVEKITDSKKKSTKK